MSSIHGEMGVEEEVSDRRTGGKWCNATMPDVYLRLRGSALAKMWLSIRSFGRAKNVLLEKLPSPPMRMLLFAP
jgi:hypothetical protein